MISIWWVTLILALVVGAWCLGYQSRQSRLMTQKMNLPRDYLVGLNYLLNEEPDKSRRYFLLKMLEIDSETVETHLAVGKLFRRRGEVDRAIRIHQNLIARPHLDKACREQSLFELGQDYMSAGVLDRAERIFLDVVNIKEYAVPALYALLDIYQQEKAWEQAIQTAHRLAMATKKNMQPIIAHYYCELAEIAFQKGQNEQASQWLREALQADENSVRASLTQARVDMSKGDYKSALKSLKKNKKIKTRIIYQNPLNISLLVMKNCKKKKKLVSYLMKMLEQYPHVPVVLILSERIRKRKGDKVAAKYVADYVRRYPSLRGLHLFINLYMSSTEGRAREDLTILQNLTRKLLSNKPDYQCISCGFSGKTLHWLCPGCKQWSSVKPVHCLEH